MQLSIEKRNKTFSMNVKVKNIYGLRIKLQISIVYPIPR